MIQAVILAAGRGVRVQPLSFTKPKPLIEIAGKTLLEHNLDQLEGIASEVVLVVGYKHNLIEQKIGSKYKGIKIKYVNQAEQTGTGSAVFSARKLVKDKFLLLMGDDFYSKRDIQEVVKKYPAIAVKEVKDPKNFGIVTERKGVMVNFIEKPTNPRSNLANTALYCLPKSVLDYKIVRSARGEYEFTDYLKQFADDQKLNVSISKDWMPISYVWNFLDAAEYLLGKMLPIISGKIEEGVIIKGQASVSALSLVKSEAIIIGPVFIGQKCLLEKDCLIEAFTSIGNDCRIMTGSQIKNSLIGQRTIIDANASIKDSIIGDNCYIGKNVKIVNSNKGKNITMMVGGKEIETKRKKLGAAIGDNVKIGDGTIIMPGIKIAPNRKVPANSQITKDIE